MDNQIIYVSGKISGLPDLNKPKFEAATRELRSRGFIVRNPHEICDGLPEDQWSECMKRCIAVMMECSIILFLDDWYDSKGATIEYKLAKDLNIPTELFPAFINRLNLKPIE
jgi:hypothetical protein